jgi:hypothetical protein
VTSRVCMSRLIEDPPAALRSAVSPPIYCILRTPERLRESRGSQRSRDREMAGVGQQNWSRVYVFSCVQHFQIHPETPSTLRTVADTTQVELTAHCWAILRVTTRQSYMH